MANLRKNVASQNMTFALIDATDGSSPITSANLTTLKSTSFVTKDNGSQTGAAGTFTEKGNGQYNYSPTQGETNADDVGILFTYTGAVIINYDFHTDVVDANGYPDVNVVDAAGTAWASGAIVKGCFAVDSLDNITAFSVPIRKLIGVIASAEAGETDGAGTGTFTISAYGSDGASDCIVGTVDSGNRTHVVVTLPT